MLEPFTHGRARFPLFWWPPLYPLLLAAFNWAGLGLITAASWVDATLLVGTAILIGMLVRSATRSSNAGFAAAVFLAISPAIFTIYSATFSEPLFLFLSYLGLGLLAAHLRSGRWSTLVLASASIALALLTRYAGLPLVATGVLALLLFGRRSALDRLTRSVCFGLVALLPLVLWLVRNDVETGFTTGRSVSWHPLTFRRFTHETSDITLFLFPELHGAAHVMAFGLMAAALIATAPFVWRRIEAESIPPFIAIVLLYIPVYAISLVLTTFLFDSATNLTMRFLLPLYPGVVALIVWTFSSVAAASPALRRYLVLVIGATACLALVSTAVLARDLHAKGREFTSRAWRTSDGIAWIRARPAAMKIYTNAGIVAYFLTGRYVSTVPVELEAANASPNPAYREELSTLVRDVRRGAVVVIFEHAPRLTMASDSVIATRLGAAHFRHLGDATIFGRV
jgi:4-amino-4-deoxy-L-arabinose transferase-like glycosyltransferase